MIYLVTFEAPGGRTAFEPERYDSESRAVAHAIDTTNQYPHYHVDVWEGYEEDSDSDIVGGRNVFCSFRYHNAAQEER